MYSIVVATMLTTGTPAPAFGGLFSRSNESCFGGCQGCQGCFGGGCFGCSGGCSGGCAGCFGCQGCNGCSGGCNGFLGIRDFFSNVFSMGGCNGCSGYSGCNGCMGCYGGCYGGCGGFPTSGYGFSTSGYEMPMMMTSMPMGNMNSAPGMDMMTYGMPSGMPGNVTLPAPPLNQTSPLPYGPPPQLQESTVAANQATVIVNLPADARLYVEKHLMELTGSVRAFRTPDLTPGTRYTYTIRMEVERGGRMVEKTETVTIEAGKRTQVSFADPGDNGNTARAAYTVSPR